MYTLEQAMARRGSRHRIRCYVWGHVKYTKDIEPVTALKREAAELITRARERATPIVITQSGKTTAVLVDVESYERDRSAFMLLKLMAQGERDYAEGHTVSHADAAKEFRRQLAELGDDE